MFTFPLSMMAPTQTQLMTDLDTLLEELRLAAIDAGGSGLANWAVFLADESTVTTAVNLGSLGGDASKGSSDIPIASVDTDFGGRSYWDLSTQNQANPQFWYEFTAANKPLLDKQGTVIAVAKGDQGTNHGLIGVGDGSGTGSVITPIMATTDTNITWRTGGGNFRSASFSTNTLAKMFRLSTNLSWRAEDETGEVLTGTAASGDFSNADGITYMLKPRAIFRDFAGSTEGARGLVGGIFLCDLDLSGSGASGGFANAEARAFAAVKTYFGR